MMRQSLKKSIKNDLEISCKMIVIENRKELVDKIKSKDIENSENLQSLAKHVASEAVESCIKQRKERTCLFLKDLNAKREHDIHVLALASASA